MSDADDLWGMVAGQYPDLVRPDAALIRYVQPDEAPGVIADCLRDQGFTDVTVLPDGGVLTDYGSEAQAEAYALANFICRVSYQVDPRFTAPLTQQEVRDLYVYYSEQLGPCLTAEGFDVEEAPSEATFIEEYETGSYWQPYEHVADAVGSNGEWYAISEQCPQTQPGFRE